MRGSTPERFAKRSYKSAFCMAYHHLNFAWNIRRVATSRYATLTQQEFEVWGKYPSDIETSGE